MSVSASTSTKLLLTLQATNAALEVIMRSKAVIEDLVRAHNNDGHVTEEDKKKVNDEYQRLIELSEQARNAGV